jgi:Carboxypeptidase regulatory-like domain/TonB-dependent Receptor Plug Domain
MKMRGALMNKSKWMFLGVLMLAVFVAFAPCVSAQESAAKGTLNGTVVDSTGGAIVGASVTLSGPFGNQNQTTNGLGVFIFQDLIPGTYKVRIEMKGFRVAEVPDATVNVGRVSAIRVQLEPGSITSTVEIIASAVTVDTTTTAVATNLNDDFYNKLPVQRGVAGLFYLAPGVVSGGGTGAANPSIGGATGLENLYVADGVSITDTAFGGLGLFTRVYGSVGTGINLSFIKEVQIKTGAFQPQYGGATGGVVQIVTKSGGNQYHGAIAGFWQPKQFEATRLNADDFGLANPFGKVTHVAAWDTSGEIGGPVPLVGKDKLFFFGSFDPTDNLTYQIAPPTTGNFLFGHVNGSTYVYNYAAKLTYKLNDKNTIEGSVFGDPSYSNNFPWVSLRYGVLGIPNNTNYSKLTYGTRDVVGRYNGTLSPTWVLNIDGTWQHNKFTEGFNNTVPLIEDQTQTRGLPGQAGVFFPEGHGYVENTRDESYGTHINTTKIFNFWGQHSFDVGYAYVRGYYDGQRAYSGGGNQFPLVNSAGGTLCPGAAGGQCAWANGLANNEYYLRLAPGFTGDTSGAPPCTLCPVMNVPGFATPQPVYLRMLRSEFGVNQAGFLKFGTHSRNHTAYVNDSWTINKYVTVDAGVRWQEERMVGEQAQYAFTGDWSPRLGVSIDPIGDRKNKIFFNFGRYSYNLPLDLAERSLTNEIDLSAFRFVPDFTTGGACAPVTINANTFNRCVNINPATGSVTPVIDPMHNVNNISGNGPGGISATPSFSSGGALEFIHSGTKLTYEDEYVFGAEHEFSHGVILTARYTRRALRRIVEDTGGISPEASLAGITQFFSITNPHKSLDIFTNPIAHDYNTAVGPPAACGGDHFDSGPLSDSLGNPVFDSNGNNAACFSEGTDASTGSIVPVGIHGCPATGACTAAGSPVSDGIPDGFSDPIHRYWSFEVEVNKSFSHNWQLRANYRVAKLFGNFEGAYRNDNGQSDPGISSLFDFTPGSFNLLGQQFLPGVLNTDRQQVGNGYFSYVFDHGMLKNLTLGTGVRVQTGTPINELAAHPVYQNAGEVPIGGRGSQGRTPTTGSIDFHGDYVMNITEKFHVRFGADLFNIANTRRVQYFNQNIDLGFGVPNADFLKPDNQTIARNDAIQAPFNCRVFARLEF